MADKTNPPPTCTSCMGWGTVWKSTTVFGADEKGLPTETTTTASEPCGSCGGKGTK